jgi:hypothetical protein
MLAGSAGVSWISHAVAVPAAWTAPIQLEIMLTEVLEVIRHVLASSGSQVEVVNLIDSTDR